MENQYVPQYQYAPAAGPQVPPPAPKKSRTWLIVLIVIAAALTLMVVSVSSCTSAVINLASSANNGIVVTQDSVATLTMDGSIEYDGSVCSPEGFKEYLDYAESEPRIKALVLRVNSGGGVATAGEEMTQYLKNFSKPVVISSASMNASAAYEISSQADYIFVAHSTAIGSIGTAMTLTDLSGLYKMLGISIDTIASADSKDSTYGNRPWTEDERAFYQEQVNQINDHFVNTVAEGRKMSVESVRALATGLTFTGDQAVDNGLADKVGTMEDAVQYAARLANLQTFEVVSLDPQYDRLDTLLSLMGARSDSDGYQNLANALKELENHDSALR